MNVLAELNEAYCPSFEWRRKQKSSILGWPVFQTFKQWASLPRTVHSWFQNFETTRKWGIGFATRSLATRSSCVSSCYLWHHIEPQILDLLQAKQCNYFLFINRLIMKKVALFETCYSCLPWKSIRGCYFFKQCGIFFFYISKVRQQMHGFKSHKITERRKHRIRTHAFVLFH